MSNQKCICQKLEVANHQKYGLEICDSLLPLTVQIIYLFLEKYIIVYPRHQVKQAGSTNTTGAIAFYYILCCSFFQIIIKQYRNCDGQEASTNKSSALFSVTSLLVSTQKHDNKE